MARTRTGDVDLPETARHLGFGKACNLGAARGQSPFVLFLNPDAWLQPGSLSVPLDFRERLRDVVAPGARGASRKSAPERNVE